MKYAMAVIAMLTLTPMIVSGQSGSTSSTQTVLFICEHGAGRSPIAAAYFNKIAKEKGLNYVAIFRGTQPDSVLGKTAREGLTKDHYNIDGWKPKLLSDIDLKAAHTIVTLDLDLPPNYNTPHRVINWTNIPIGEGYTKAGSEIKKKVEHLVDSLSNK